MPLEGITIHVTGQDEDSRWIKALVCGDPGTGKTLFSSTWPDPLVISAEGGLLSLRERNIRYVKYEGLDQLRTIVKALRDTDSHEDNFGGPVQTIVIDTIDEISHALLRDKQAEMKQTGSKNSYEEWSYIKDTLKSVVTAIRNLPMNVVFTCHLRSKGGDDGDPTRYWPSVDGSFSEEFAGYVDVAGLLRTAVVSEIENGQSVRKIRRYLQTFPEPPAHTWIKDRSGTLPQEFELNLADDYERLHGFINGNVVIADKPEARSTDTTSTEGGPALSPDQSDEEILAEIDNTKTSTKTSNDKEAA